MNSENMIIQWYPGHMTKTRRQIEADLKQVDAVCEIVDARIPMSSRNPDIDSICENKPRIIVLNRSDLADSEATKRWIAWFKSKGLAALATDCKKVEVRCVMFAAGGDYHILLVDNNCGYSFDNGLRITGDYNFETMWNKLKEEL